MTDLLKCYRTIAILYKIYLAQPLISLAKLYLFIGKISSFLNDYQFAGRFLYLASFYIETQEKSNSEVKIHIDLLKQLAMCECVLESNNGRIIVPRAFKIMTSALKIAIYAYYPNQDFLMELDIKEWLFPKLFTFIAAELSAGMPQHQDQLGHHSICGRHTSLGANQQNQAFNFQLPKVRDQVTKPNYVSRLLEGLSAINKKRDESVEIANASSATAANQQEHTKVSLESNNALLVNQLNNVAELHLNMQMWQNLRPSESSASMNNLYSTWDNLEQQRETLGNIFQTLMQGPLNFLFLLFPTFRKFVELCQLLLSFNSEQLTNPETMELIREKLKLSICEIANNILAENSIISIIYKFICNILNINDSEISIPLNTDRIDTVIERTKISKNPLDVIWLFIFYLAKINQVTFIEHIKIREIIIDKVFHLYHISEKILKYISKYISLENFLENKTPISLFYEILHPLLNNLQMYLAIFQTDKALLAAEKYCMRSWMLQHISPNSISESPNSTIKDMQNYSHNKSTAILYIADSGVNDCDCWLLLPDIIDLLHFPLSKHTDFSYGQGFASCSDFPNGLKPQINKEVHFDSQLLFETKPLGDTLFRKFTKGNNQNHMTQQINDSILKFNLWQATSYHLSMSGAKRLVVIPQLRFYNISFCLLGNINNLNSRLKSNNKSRNIEQSLADYPLLKKYILSISPAFGVLASDANEFKANNDNHKACVLIIANPEQNLAEAENEKKIVFKQLNNVKIFKNKVKSIENESSENILKSLENSTIVHFCCTCRLRSSN